MLLDEIELKSPEGKLVHYTRELVPVYHSWFQKYPELLDRSETIGGAGRVVSTDVPIERGYNRSPPANECHQDVPG